MRNERLIKNEQLIRSKNVKVKNGLKRYFQNDRKVNITPLTFLCECSDLNCKAHVQISIDEYEKVHKQRNQFVIAEGHETPAVEKVVAHKGDLTVVKKPALKA